VRRWLPLLATASLFLAACLQPQPTDLEATARDMERNLMCQVCPGQTIAESSAPLALQIKALIRERLAAGESRESIISYLVDRYGESILASPPKRGANLLLWVLPASAIAAGGGFLYWVLRRWRRGTLFLEPVPEEPPDYAQRVDQELEEFRY